MRRRLEEDETKWVCRITDHISSRLTNVLGSFRKHTAWTDAKEFVCEVVPERSGSKTSTTMPISFLPGIDRPPKKKSTLACRSIIPTTPGPCTHLDDMNKKGSQHWPSPDRTRTLACVSSIWWRTHTSFIPTFHSSKSYTTFRGDMVTYSWYEIVAWLNDIFRKLAIFRFSAVPPATWASSWRHASAVHSGAAEGHYTAESSSHVQKWIKGRWRVYLNVDATYPTRHRKIFPFLPMPSLLLFASIGVLFIIQKVIAYLRAARAIRLVPEYDPATSSDALITILQTCT